MAMRPGVPGSVRRRVFRRDGYRCRECGLPGREVRFPRGGFGYPSSLKGVNLSVDHIIPRSRGGSSHESNLRVLCVPCNTYKGTKLEAEL